MPKRKEQPSPATAGALAQGLTSDAAAEAAAAEAAAIAAATPKAGSVLAQVMSEPLVEDNGSDDDDNSGVTPSSTRQTPLSLVPSIPRDELVSRPDVIPNARPHGQKPPGPLAAEQSPEDLAAIPPSVRAVRDPIDGSREMSPRTIDPLDPLTRALGGRNWRANHVFDWCRENDGRRHRFTRWYFDANVRVLVDLFAAPSGSVASEVRQKSAQIALYNEWLAATDVERAGASFEKLRRCFVLPDISQQRAGLKAIGYLPAVRGVHIPPEAIAAAARGEIVALITPFEQTAGIIA